MYRHLWQHHCIDASWIHCLYDGTEAASSNLPYQVLKQCNQHATINLYDIFNLIDECMLVIQTISFYTCALMHIIPPGWKGTLIKNLVGSFRLIGSVQSFASYS